jgi:hypothetical protein
MRQIGKRFQIYWKDDEAFFKCKPFHLDGKFYPVEPVLIKETTHYSPLLIVSHQLLDYYKFFQKLKIKHEIPQVEFVGYFPKVIRSYFQFTTVVVFRNVSSERYDKIMTFMLKLFPKGKVEIVEWKPTDGKSGKLNPKTDQTSKHNAIEANTLTTKASKEAIQIQNRKKRQKKIT